MKKQPTALSPDDPWRVSEQGFPRAGAAEEKLKFLLNFAVLAPSGHNRQPWRFRVTGDEVELCADRQRALPTVDPGDRELVMSCGAALLHLRVAIQHYGFQPIVHTFPNLADRDLLAIVRIGPPQEAALKDHRLFMAIKRRRTRRRPFEKRPVPDAELEALRAAAGTEGGRLHVMEAGPREKLIDLIAEGDRVQESDEQFRRELARWMTPSRSAPPEGVPGYARGQNRLQSQVDPLIEQAFDRGKQKAAQNRLLARNAPVLLILATETDSAAAHLAAGQALARTLLTGADYGLSTSFLNQPLQVPALRAKAARLLGGGHPQMVLRMGYGGGEKPTPRRAVREVTVNSRP